MIQVYQKYNLKQDLLKEESERIHQRRKGKEKKQKENMHIMENACLFVMVVMLMWKSLLWMCYQQTT